MTQQHKRQSETKMVPVPSHSIVPERDVDKRPVLETRHLGVEFGGLKAVEDFNLTIGRTEIAGLIGPNGAGKTTVFNLLTKVYQPTTGVVILDGKDTAGMNAVQANKLGVARTFQNIRLFTGGTVLQNVMTACWVRQKAPWWSAPLYLPIFRREEREIRERSMELLEAVGLDKLAGEIATGLPYGAQRRLEIVRALATNPSLLLLDEPAAGMNPHETEELMDSIIKIRDQFQIAVMLIEHDMKLVMGICEGICVLNYGRVIAKGTAEEIQKNPTVIEAYLGRRKEDAQ